MLQFAFCADGIKLSTNIVGGPDHSHSFLFPKLAFNDCGERKDTHARFAERAQQREIFELTSNDRPYSLRLEPEIQIAPQRRVVGGQEHRRAIERSGKVARVTRRRPAPGDKDHAALTQKMTVSAYF